MRSTLIFVLPAVLAGCGGDRDLPRFGETVIAVDVDLPVPKVVSRLRIDVYAEDGTWLDSREVARPNPADWPASFSVYSENEAQTERVFVRLRVFPTGRVRDYRGERFWDWSSGTIVTPDPIDGALPRLVVDGDDRTPATEPSPLVTVDRLLLVRIEPGTLNQVDVLLNAACAGTMAFFGDDPTSGPQLGLAETCADVERLRVVVEDSPLDDRHDPGPSQQDRHDQPCAVAVGEGQVCVPGGVTILGSTELTLIPDRPPVPERIVVLSPFSMDVDEVTVARFRAALDAGFSPPTNVQLREGPLDGTVAGNCTFSTTDQGRESHPLNCVDWFASDAFCAWAGGALPSEAQWEHAATQAGERGLSTYPSGDAPPTCEQAVHGRLDFQTPGVCTHLDAVPEPVDASADVTPLGLRGLAGNVSEWQRDHYDDYAAPCWTASSSVDPQCVDDATILRSMRGGSWPAPPTILPSAVRQGADSSGSASFIGFRCVYPGAP